MGTDDQGSNPSAIISVIRGKIHGRMSSLAQAGWVVSLCKYSISEGMASTISSRDCS